MADLVAEAGTDAHVSFLETAARYFGSRPTKGEDMAHWANVYNAENCRRAAYTLLRLESELAAERERNARLVARAKRLASASEAFVHHFVLNDLPEGPSRQAQSVLEQVQFMRAELAKESKP